MKRILRGCLLLVLLFTAGCSALSALGPKPTPGAVTATPNVLTPTPSLAGYRISDGLACPLAQLTTIATTAEQGSLVAWSPSGKQIAFIAPQGSQTMFTGSLTVASGADFKTTRVLAENVYGSVSWAPDEKRVAYVMLRPADNVYTVMVSSLESAGLIDLFPGKAAQLDHFSSPKVVLSWIGPDSVEVLAACGDGCNKHLRVSVPGGAQAELAAVTDDALPLLWQAPRHTLQVTPALYPNMTDPNWSSDSKMVTYYDDSGFLWVLLEHGKLVSQLNMTNAAGLPVYLKDTWNRESHWSADGKLAVRVGGALEIFVVPCKS